MLKHTVICCNVTFSVGHFCNSLKRAGIFDKYRQNYKTFPYLELLEWKVKTVQTAYGLP